MREEDGKQRISFPPEKNPPKIPPFYLRGEQMRQKDIKGIEPS